MTSVTQRILRLLELECETFALEFGEGPSLEDRIRYYLAKRELFRCIAESAFDAAESADAIAAYREADSKVLQLSARTKIRDGLDGETPRQKETMARLAGFLGDPDTPGARPPRNHG